MPASGNISANAGAMNHSNQNEDDGQRGQQALCPIAAQDRQRQAHGHQATMQMTQGSSLQPALLGQGNNFPFADPRTAREENTVNDNCQPANFGITRPTPLHHDSAGAAAWHQVLHGCINHT